MDDALKIRGIEYLHETACCLPPPIKFSGYAPVAKYDSAALWLNCYVVAI